MNPDLIAILRAIASALSDGLIGGGDAARYGSILDKAATLGEYGAKGAAGLRAIRADVERFVAEKRAPTQAETDALVARSDAAHERIQRDRTPADGGG